MQSLRSASARFLFSGGEKLPPSGLKLEGGSLTGEPAKYIGTYRLDHSKLVNGRPAYQHTTDATLWIAFCETRWMGQHQSYLGKNTGIMDLIDSAAASPDVSAETWKAWTGSAWVEQPQLKCTVWRPPLSVAEKAAIEKAAADKKNTKKVAAEKAADQKVAAAKALQEAEDAQLAAAIAASLNVSEHPVARVKRWGDGLEAPAAGSRHFVPQGFELKLDVPEQKARAAANNKTIIEKMIEADKHR